MSAPAIALLEVSSIAQGIFLCDVIVKKAPVRLIRYEAVSPGKYMLLFGGDVACVEESYQAAMEESDGELLDALYLPYLHEQVMPAIEGKAFVTQVDAVGIFETHTVSSGIVAADAALKAADVSLIEFKLAKGIGGKAFFTLTGSHYEVEAALEAAYASREDSSCVRKILIPNPHEEFLPVILKSPLPLEGGGLGWG